MRVLTPWLLVYNYIIPGNWGKTKDIWLSYQPHSSSADCARELFKPSKDSASLRLCNDKKYLVLGFSFSVSDVTSKVGFWLLIPDLGPTARQKYFTEVLIGN